MHTGKMEISPGLNFIDVLKMGLNAEHSVEFRMLPKLEYWAVLSDLLNAPLAGAVKTQLKVILKA
jgi:hypothetical protein